MNYFKKSGVRSEEEQALLQAIESAIAAKGISRDEIPECHSLDDLIEVKHLVDAYVITSGEIVEVKEDQLALEELQAEEPLMEGDELPEVVELDETESKGIHIIEGNHEPEPELESDIEVSESLEENEFSFDSGDYDPFAEQIIERSYSGGDQVTPFPDQEEPDPENFDIKLDEATEPTPLDSPEERTKKKAAEQTADTILKGYARLAPKPFKWLAKFSESKIEKMAFRGQINVDIQVSEGVTFDDYMRQTNEQVDEIFQVDEDTIEEIREPLVEVLMEQQLELTPQQRLGMAVLSHLMQMFTVAMKLRNQNNRILAYQKELTRLSKTNVA